VARLIHDQFHTAHRAGGSRRSGAYLVSAPNFTNVVLDLATRISSIQEILVELFRTGDPAGPGMHQTFSSTLRERLVQCAEDLNVAGFKSVACYRTGLDVSIVTDPAAEVEALCGAYENHHSSGWHLSP
jgi:hypothetical protein